MRVTYQSRQRDFFDSFVAHRNRSTITKWCFRLFACIFFTLAGASLLAVAVRAQTLSKSNTAGGQTSFCEEGAPDELVLKPVPLPSVILTTVMKTKEGKEARERATRDGNELVPERLLKGAPVHLTDSHELFFVVMGSSPMSGADNTWFWVVRQSGKRAIVLLFAGANCLDINQTKTLGYKDVVTTWSSASTEVTATYRYDGKSYKLWRRKSGPNPITGEKSPSHK